MLPLRQKLGLDVPVLLTDSHRNFIIGTDLSEHANTISATRMPDRKHAAALVKQTLAQKCTQLTKLLRGEAKADPAGQQLLACMRLNHHEATQCCCWELIACKAP